MAKVIGGIGSMLSGKIEGLVFVNYPGGTYVRRAPQRTKDSVTPAMKLNQQRFGAIIAFCGQFKSTLIPQIWSPVVEKGTGYKLFLRTNSPAFAKDGSLAEAKKLQFSTGKLTLPNELKAVRRVGEASTIDVSWQKDTHLSGIRLKDEIMVISAANGIYSDLTATGLLRSTLGGLFELPQLPAAATHIYLFFASQDRRDYSESVCFEV